MMKWWQKAVFYQIYPRSFSDGNGDGIGDFQGMISKLDYLDDLGVDAIWLSPHYPSPLRDCGYDISDYCSVAPEYGTWDDFYEFLDGLHKRGMYLILDLVLNHTSDQHPWFIESRSSRDNPKRDWYIWHAGENGMPPNNWFSTFGGSAWEFDPQTKEYYYHFFFKEQPDLNWRNSQVREAIWDVARFWLDLGVDGFRLDAVGTIYEDSLLSDQHAGINLDDLYVLERNSKIPQEHTRVVELWEEIFKYQHDQPGMHELMRELREVINEYPDRVLVGETDDLSYYGNGSDELHMVFNFPLMRTRRLSADWVRTNQSDRLERIPKGGWACNNLGNHDSARMMRAYGDGIHDDCIVRFNLAMLLTLKGTPFLFTGAEIGMTTAVLTNPDEFRDPLSLRTYELEMRLFNCPGDEAASCASGNGRDETRSPMQWKNAPNGGFCPQGIKPWLPVNQDYQQGVNVETQLANDSSLWHYYKNLLSIRRENPALVEGEYQPMMEDDQDILVFRRISTVQNCLVICNTCSENRIIKIPHFKHPPRIVYSSLGREGTIGGDLRLKPFEVLIMEEVNI